LPPQAGLHREPWIRSQPAGHYTLQLLGTRNEDSVGRFVRDHELEGELAYFRRLHEGADWFTLLYGSFPSRAAAEAAVAGLPSPIRTAKPWPRTFASVQAQLPANP
jgi:DamX protein